MYVFVLKVNYVQNYLICILKFVRFFHSEMLNKHGNNDS